MAVSLVTARLCRPSQKKESPAKRGRAKSNREVSIVYHGIPPLRIDVNQMS